MYKSLNIGKNKLGDKGQIITGITTGKNDIFLKLWHELSRNKINLDLINISDFSENKNWIPYSKGGNFRKWYGNLEYFVNWNRKTEFNRSKTTLQHLYFKEGFTWSFITTGKFNARILPKGFLWDVAGSPAIFENDKQKYSYLALVNSNLCQKILDIFNPTMNYQSIDVQNIPLDDNILNTNISEITENCYSISKKDWDSREISWDFEQSPLLGIREQGVVESDKGFVDREKGLGNSGKGSVSLKAAYEAWVAEVSQDFFQLHTNEEELNRIFIDIYGLQDELTPEVALKDITILQDELKAEDLEALEPAFRAGEKVVLPIQANVVMQQFLSYLVGTLLGRYRLGRKGLHIAHPNPTDEELAPYPVDNVALPFQMEIDEDAIIPIMGSTCAFPDDAVKRVDDIIHRIWGDASHTENLNFINQCLGMDYEKWMCEQFWAYHISGTMYKKKPIYWLFCSNPKSPQKSAFRVLVYMHRMDAYTVQKILRNYLHPHIEYVKGKYEEMHANEANLTKQEFKAYENLAKQISELKEYEQKLKEVANQQITFDLDDGVKVNYAKFEGVVAVIK
ncbi:BREX-1 system adenine-specific DNA-methyltransferase PglX [Xiashengella succiniciproducens]|uniref:site-specific DNA-methyltransferase (adenine-specific) n=1 Tax=Xiashengella succiniciproducens TaxID=2949635 RepID=A0A9J6ZSG8_9BACT|nr:BREX-1 system adenine-specific DNA-methyltransferase PglX [Alkaliflexus sp. Ai-910]URW80671.1 BREX-1 system adenine-specific DNA-methyltransferase PglX [Alkaliflexus sp. Ai-910]